jgi:hypothetical protein
MKPSSNQATVVAIFYVLLIAAVTIVALDHYSVDDFLKVWAVLGTLIGVLTGAIPSYFFAVSAANANEEREKSDARSEVILAVADPKVIEKAKEVRPDLFR